LQFIRGNSLTTEYFEEEFVEMNRGIEEEKELASAGSFYDMFKGSDLRRTIICFGTILSHAAAGLWLIIGYGVKSFTGKYRAVTYHIIRPFFSKLLVSRSHSKPPSSRPAEVSLVF